MKLRTTLGMCFIFTFLTTAALFAVEDVKPPYKWENKFIGAPLASYSPETSWSAILAAAYIYKAGAQDKETPPSSLQLYGEYTMKHQSDLSLEVHHYGDQYSWYSNLYIEYKKYPDQFFGTGNYTEDSDKEPYTPEFYKLRLIHLISVYKDVFAGAQYKLEKYNMLYKEPGGLLDTGNFTGKNGSILSGVSLIARWDTRDSKNFPRSGLFYQATADFYPDWLGSTGAFAQLTFDLRNYFPLFDEKNSISTQLSTVFISGNPQIDAMAKIGGNALLRGIYNGKYRDKNMIVLQAEYKWLAFDWLALTAFADIGEVAAQINWFSTAGIKYTYGAGVHFIVDQDSKLTLRIDMGFGANTSGLYITTLEAF